ncbi:MAG: zinc ABC transporter permease subunit ZnuB [Pantoea sp. Brub]|nr:zinc ABC transporter permease subunit ZnuB [Pantoea sp. Brub]
MFELLLPSWCGGILLVLLAGPLGCFIIWHKLSYFGDTIAHSSLLGIIFGIILDINPYLALILLSAMLAISLFWIENSSNLSIDTVLGIMSHSALSLGLVFASLIPNIRVDLMFYLFGDLLSITLKDLFIIGIFVICIIIVLILQWRSLLLMTINNEIAKTHGINIQYNRFILMLLTALTIGISMKFVGALIITSLLIIPAATARHFTRSPEQMIILAIIIGAIAVTGGLTISAFYDTPASPSIVLCSTCMFIISILTNRSNL